MITTGDRYMKEIFVLYPYTHTHILTEMFVIFLVFRQLDAVQMGNNYKLKNCATILYFRKSMGQHAAIMDTGAEFIHSILGVLKNTSP